MKDFSNVTNPWKEWTIVKQIGRGSFGSVYEIERDAYGFKEKAALKVISVPNSESDLETMRNSNYDVSKWCRSIINDIFREYALMAQLKNCPNIVRCDDCKEIPHEEDEGSDVCIRMELLNPLSKMRREFSEEEVIRIGLDICSALIACGEKNIIHRDIKPDNILVSEDGVYKLGDFGVARELDHTTAASLKGTPTFMAPEVEARKEYGRDADIYSLGLVMYWLLNNRRRPFEPVNETPTALEVQESNGRRLTGEQIPDPVNGSRELKDIILKACKFDRADRFRSPQEMYEALRAIATGDEQMETFRSERTFIPGMTPELDGTEGTEDETLPMPLVQTGDGSADRIEPVVEIAEPNKKEEREFAAKKQEKESTPEKKTDKPGGSKKGLIIGIAAVVLIAAIAAAALLGGKSEDPEQYFRTTWLTKYIAACDGEDDEGYPMEYGETYIKYAIADFNGDEDDDCLMYSFMDKDNTGRGEFSQGTFYLKLAGTSSSDYEFCQARNRKEFNEADFTFYDNGFIIERWKDGDKTNIQVYDLGAGDYGELFERSDAYLLDTFDSSLAYNCTGSLLFTETEDGYSANSITSIGASKDDIKTVQLEEVESFIESIVGDASEVQPVFYDFAEEVAAGTFD